MSIIIKLCFVLYAIHIGASQEDPLQHYVEQSLLNEIFASTSVLRAGIYPAMAERDAQPGDIAKTGICSFIDHSFFSLQEKDNHIILCRKGIFGLNGNETPNKILNQWVKRSLESQGFIVNDKGNEPCAYSPVQKMCIDEKSNPQVKCYMYNPEKNKTWTDFTLKLTKDSFAIYKTLYFDALLQKNPDQKSIIETRRALLS